MSIRWTKTQQQPIRKGGDWKDVLPKSSTLQEIMTKVYEGAYVNGELSVTVIGAELQKSNSKWMASHPFCVVQLNNIDGTKQEGKLFKTAIIHKDVNPCWNEAFIMDLRSKTEIALWIEVRSYVMIGKDKLLGKCVISESISYSPNIFLFYVHNWR
jgi:Ca2+-dependent lipid-binding protein